MDEGSACTSRLTLYFGSAAAPARPRPGDVIDPDDEHLRVVRRTVVEPVVESLLTGEELQALSVHRGVDGDPGDAWVCVVAVGEVFEDWVAESRFGWGQQRTARYVLPPS